MYDPFNPYRYSNKTSLAWHVAATPNARAILDRLLNELEAELRGRLDERRKTREQKMETMKKNG